MLMLNNAKYILNVTFKDVQVVTKRKGFSTKDANFLDSKFRTIILYIKHNHFLPFTTVKHIFS